MISPAPADDPSRRPLQPRKILLIDTSLSDASLLAEAVEDEQVDLTIDHCPGLEGVAGYWTATAVPPDLILLSIDHPDRMQVTRARRMTTESPARGTPLVIWSSHLSNDRARICESTGAQTCIVKPGSFSDYRFLVQRLMAIIASRPTSSQSLIRLAFPGGR